MTTSSVTAAILGGGMLGRAVARIVGVTEANLRIWARRGEAREHLGTSLPHATVAESVAEAARGVAMVFFAVPASALREVASAYGEVATGDQIVIHAVRGICPGEAFTLPHRVIREETCVRKIGVLGGPLYAPELLSENAQAAPTAARRPLAAVLASRFDEPVRLIRELTEPTPVKVHASHDVIGVEVAGAVSNVSALAAGMAEALGLGDTARGVLLTCGLSEAARLGMALGAQARTFAGLAGVGDLIPRKVASTERHHFVGAALAEGKSLEQALAEVEGEVEGVLSAECIVAEAERRGLELVLARAVDDVAKGRRSAADGIDEVLQHDLDLGRGLDYATP